MFPIEVRNFRGNRFVINIIVLTHIFNHTICKIINFRCVDTVNFLLYICNDKLIKNGVQKRIIYLYSQNQIPFVIDCIDYITKTLNCIMKNSPIVKSSVTSRLSYIVVLDLTIDYLIKRDIESSFPTINAESWKTVSDLW